MKLTLQVKLLPTKSQHTLLLQTMAVANAAANFVAEVGFKEKVFSQIQLHRLCYRTIRERFGLSAQMTVRAIGKAVEAFKRSKKKCLAFRPHGAITYDPHIFSWKGLNKASLWTLEGRQIIPIVFGQYQAERFGYAKGQVDLVYRDGQFYVYATIDMPENPPVEIHDFLGIDMGIVNIAADSDGSIHSGKNVNRVRQRNRSLRTKLQKTGSKSAKRKLKKISGKEKRFAKNVNHCIAKHIVAKAQRTARGIAIENLKHIRKRVTARRSQRAALCSWAFAQLRSFIEYKAKVLGVLVVAVDPRNTSRTCPVCGCIDKKNRVTQNTFSCISCGHVGVADLIAAENIRRAAVNQPIVAVA